MRSKEEILKDMKICNLSTGCAGCSFYAEDGYCNDGDIDKEIIDYLESNIDYNNGMKDAWEIAREVCSMEDMDFCECFKCEYIDEVFFNYSINEVKKMIDDYCKEKNKIVVGDIVYYDGMQRIVVSVSCNTLYLLNENRVLTIATDSKVAKTGKHFDLSGLFSAIHN